MNDAERDLNEQIRERVQAKRLVPEEAEQNEPKSELSRDRVPDFGGGARRIVQAPEDMNTLIRASYYGSWRQTGIGGR